MTHACGYEHPCQMNMRDIDISGGDNNKLVNLEKTYGYKKEEVPFNSMESLFNCSYLSGLKQEKNKLIYKSK